METKKIKIVADSSSDVLNLSAVPFCSAPLKIITTEKEYVDDINLDVYNMVTELGQYKGKSSTSCPNSADWLETFGDADEIYCVTITATLSGSYNAAMMAKQVYEEMYPERKVFVLNSLTAGPEMSLIIDKIEEMVLADKPFEEICKEVEDYSQKTGLLFVLESMRNLANNGRVSHLVAKMTGILGIRVVGKASDVGDLEPLNKCRGEAKSLNAITEHLSNLGLKTGKVKISHCFNEETAIKLKDLINTKFPKAKVEINECRGLCSFYAEKGGMLIGFEKI